MKIEEGNYIKNFEEVKVGEVFSQVDGDYIYLRIEVDNEYTVKGTHDGLGVNLYNGVVTWFDNTEKVIIFPNAKVVC